MKRPIAPLTPQQRAGVLKWLPGGSDRAAVCDAVGVTLVQLQLEMKRDPEFAQQVARAEASMELLQMNRVIKATDDDKNWRTSIWWIERRTRERLRRANASLSEADVFELVDAIACTISQDLPESDCHRRMIERLFAIAARQPLALVRVGQPADQPAADPPAAAEIADDGAPGDFPDDRMSHPSLPRSQP
jgi:hypothetical protein